MTKTCIHCGKETLSVIQTESGYSSDPHIEIDDFRVFVEKAKETIKKALLK